MRLVAIGGTPIDQVCALLAGAISHDTEIWVKAVSPNYLVTPEILQALAIVPDLDKAAFTFETSNGRRITLIVTAPARGDTVEWLYLPHRAQPSTPVYRRNPNLYYWFDYLPDSRSLYFQYNRCQEAATLPFAAFMQQLLDFVAGNDIRRFVIDLRNNGGGSTLIIQPLLELFRQQVAQHALEPRVAGVRHHRSPDVLVGRAERHRFQIAGRHAGWRARRLEAERLWLSDESRAA
jgi:Peptidase family S41